MVVWGRCEELRDFGNSLLGADVTDGGEQPRGKTNYIEQKQIYEKKETKILPIEQ